MLSDAILMMSTQSSNESMSFSNANSVTSITSSRGISLELRWLNPPVIVVYRFRIDFDFLSHVATPNSIMWSALSIFSNSTSISKSFLCRFDQVSFAEAFLSKANCELLLLLGFGASWHCY